MRINRASDDPAGFAMASSLQTASRLYVQASRNINDGMSALSIAEDQINGLVDITNRLKELAEQGANGTLSSTQRGALDAEAQALVKEYVRVTQTTTFNGVQLLDGTFQNVNIQAGIEANTSNQISLSIASLFGNGSTTTNGTGQFSAVVSSATTGRDRDVVTYDINGDGILDLIEADESNTAVVVQLGVGDGTFGASQGYSSGSGTAGTAKVAIGDFNGDGKKDLIVTNSNFGQQAVLLGNGDGTFKARVIYTASAPGNSSSVTTGDFNGDGRDDFAVTQGGGFTTMSIFLANSDGSFNAATSSSVGYSPNSIQAYDINGDGKLDLVAQTQFGSNSVAVFLGAGDGTFGAANNFATIASGVAGDMLIKDVNNDGKIDIISTNLATGKIDVLLGNGTEVLKLEIHSKQDHNQTH